MELSYFKEVVDAEKETTFRKLFEKLKSYGVFGKQEATLLERWRHANPKLVKTLALSTLLANVSFSPPEDESDIQVGEPEEVSYSENRSNLKESLSDDESVIDYADVKRMTGELEGEVNKERRRELLSQITGVTVGMIKDGVKKREYFSAEELMASGVIELQGYFTGIQIVTPSNFEAHVNGDEVNVGEDMPLTPEGYDHREEGDVYGSYYGIPEKSAQTVVLELDDGEGDPVKVKFSQAEFVEEMGEVYVPTFEVAGEDTLSSHIDTTRISTIDINKQEVKEIPDWKEKFRTAGHAIADLEATFESNVINSLGVVGYDKKNAVVWMGNEKTMYFFEPYLYELSSDQIAKTARHEALHMLDADRGYSRNKEIRELFADIHGFSEGTQLYQNVMKEGGLDSEAGAELDNMEFFTTIDEANFISDARGGHSWEDTREFVATFMNTLHHLEDLPRVLSEVEDSPKWIAQGEGEQAFIDKYLETLDAFLHIARENVKESNRFQPDVEFFVEKRREIKEKIAEAGLEEHSIPPLPPHFEDQVDYE